MRLWKDFLRQLARDYAGNRVVFSCRHLDYSVTLSSKDLPVPQVRIEPLSDAQVQEFLTLYCPEHSATLWQNLQGTPQLDLLRSPYYLKLLVAQTTAGRFRLAGPPCSRALYDRPYGAKWRVITRCFGPMPCCTCATCNASSRGAPGPVRAARERYPVPEVERAGLSNANAAGGERSGPGAHRL